MIAVQGSVLSPALSLSDSLLRVLPGKAKAVLVMSDGEFEDPNLVSALKTLVDHGVVVNAMPSFACNEFQISNTKALFLSFASSETEKFSPASTNSI